MGKVVWAESMLGVMRTMWTSVVEEVRQQDAKRDEGSSLQNASVRET